MNSANFEIKSLTKEQIILDISNIFKIVSDQANETWTTENYLSDLNGKWVYSTGAYIDDNLIGFIIASIKHVNVIHIHKLMVDSKHRSMNIGKLLLNDFVNRTQNSFTRITLKVATNNNRAIAFYENNKFRKKILLGHGYYLMERVL